MKAIKPVPATVEIHDPLDPKPMESSLAMWPSLGVQMLTVTVNELVERVNELSRLIGDDEK